MPSGPVDLASAALARLHQERYQETLQQIGARARSSTTRSAKRS